MQTQQLIINESYWSLFEPGNFKIQEFLVEDLNDSDTTAQITRNLALFLKNHDTDNNSVYGLEIKTNGSDRSSRIPLVRITPENQTIWKVVKTVQDVDKALLDLQDLIYYLQNTRKNESPLPQKVLIVASDESRYLDDEVMSNYVKRKVEESGVIWISLPFIKNFFLLNDRYSVNKLLVKSGAIFTLQTL